MKDARWVIHISAAVTVILVTGIITYLDYSDKASVSRQVKEMMLDRNMKMVKKDSNWEFIHCTPTSEDDCGRLE